MSDDVPEGFSPFPHVSPFLDSVGRFYVRGEGADLVLGVRVDERALNRRGTVHGGFLAALADVALGYTLASLEQPYAALTTASLTLDYLGAARAGDWLETHAEPPQLGKLLGFASVYLTVGEKRVARASGVFVRPQKPA